MENHIKCDSPVPIMKWVGGKRQLCSKIIKETPSLEGLKYYEPFIGGGAILLALHPQRAVINDFNEELINVYRVVKDSPFDLLEDLKKHINSEEYFYKLRNIDRHKEEYSQLSDIERASRTLYLNKTCFNGLYRVNRKGEFNAPFGRYKAPNIVNEDGILGLNRYLTSNDIEIRCGDYFQALEDADKESFVYMDPPYSPVSPTSFTSYNAGGWKDEDQVRLRDICNELNKRGVRFLLSNSDCKLIRELYDCYDISVVQARRVINSNGEKRGEVNELLIKNY